MILFSEQEHRGYSCGLDGRTWYIHKLWFSIVERVAVDVIFASVVVVVSVAATCGCCCCCCARVFIGNTE